MIALKLRTNLVLRNTLVAMVGLILSTSAARAADTENRGLSLPLKKMDSIVNRTRLDIGAPGMIYGVVFDGKLEYAKAFGVRNVETGAPVTTDTAFRIASMTKMMTALLVYDLLDSGELHLDYPAEHYVPALKKLKYPTRDSRKVTIRDLVNHTGGFVADDPWADRMMDKNNLELDAFLANLAPLSFPPGQRFEYSNLGYVILGRIIENISKQTFAERLQHRVFDPIGMKNSGLAVANIADEDRAFGYQKIDGTYVPEPVLASGAFDPLGGVWTTANDYGQFIAWFLSAWPARDDAEIKGAIPRRVIRMVTDGTYLIGSQVHSGASGPVDCVLPYAYGMGLLQHQHCDIGLVLRHGGGFPGYGSHMLMSPERNFGVFAFGNVTYAEADGAVWDVTHKLIKAQLGKALPDPVGADTLLLAYDAVGKAYDAGDIQAGGIAFEDNFFRDRSEERWNKQLARIRKEAGKCKKKPKLAAAGKLTGSFTWNCEKARVTGDIIMSPVNPRRLQLLHIRNIIQGERARDIVVDHDFH